MLLRLRRGRHEGITKNKVRFERAFRDRGQRQNYYDLVQKQLGRLFLGTQHMRLAALASVGGYLTRFWLIF